ncbi:MAG TPA: hypothetical protein VKR62_17325 [Roseiarcus sp.]|nr:hypothetical protein [Roseiarcus sp.]
MRIKEFVDGFPGRLMLAPLLDALRKTFAPRAPDPGCVALLLGTLVRERMEEVTGRGFFATKW